MVGTLSDICANSLKEDIYEQPANNKVHLRPSHRTKVKSIFVFFAFLENKIVKTELFKLKKNFD